MFVVATTSAITLSSDAEAGDTIDGISLSSGSILLVKDQTNEVENGLYVVPSSGAPSRASGASAATALSPGDYLAVKQGTTNASKMFAVRASSTVGTDNLNFDLHDDFQDLPPLTFTNDVSISGAQGHLPPNNEVGNGASSTFIINWDEGMNQILDLQDFSGDVTLTLNNPKDGGVYSILLIQGSTARNIIWPGAVNWPSDGVPTITTTNNRADLISLYYISDLGVYFGSFTQDYSIA